MDAGIPRAANNAEVTHEQIRIAWNLIGIIGPVFFDA